MTLYDTRTARLGYMTNPAIKRLQNVLETERTSRTATYAGVVFKTVYFLLLTVVGIAVYYALQKVLLNMSPDTLMTIDSENIFEFQITLPGLGVVFGAGILTLITALLCIFVRAIVPVTGTIYVLAEGYLLAFITDSLDSQYEWIGLLALILTIVIVMCLLALYCKNKIHVNQKFRSVTTTLFISIIVGGIALFVMSFIPGLSRISNAIAAITSNPVVSIAFSVVFILIACLFLISDFDAIHQLVEHRLPKKYEWSCAFGVAYTVLYLYIKILEIIVKIFSNSQKR